MLEMYVRFNFYGFCTEKTLPDSIHIYPHLTVHSHNFLDEYALIAYFMHIL